MALCNERSDFSQLFVKKESQWLKIDVFIDECLYLKGGLYNRISENVLILT